MAAEPGLVDAARRTCTTRTSTTTTSGYDYDEVSASVSYQQRATASVSWSPNTSKHTYWGFVWDRQALAYELSLLQPLHPRWSAYAGVGYYDLHDLVDTGYWYWSTGLAFTWQGMQVDLLHIDTDSTASRLFDRRQPLDGRADLALLEPDPLSLGTQ